MIRDYKYVKNYAKPRSQSGKMHTYKRWSLRKFFQSFRNMHDFDRKMVFIVLGLVTLVLGYLLIIRPNSLEFTVAEYDRIFDQFESKGLLIKSEQVFYAPYAGKVNIYVAEGERVPTGETIAELIGAEERKIYFARTSGLVSFQLDGLESTLRPVMLENFQQNYRDFRGKLNQISDGEKVNAGRPLFKLVDNFALYMLVEVPVDQIKQYRLGEKIWATFDNITIVGWIQKILDNRCLFIINLERFPDEILNKRWVDVTIMTDIYDGVVVPRTALAVQKDKLGVFVQRGGKIIFQAVEEVNGTANKVVVTGIERGIEVVVNSEKYLGKYK